MERRDSSSAFLVEEDLPVPLQSGGELTATALYTRKHME